MKHNSRELSWEHKMLFIESSDLLLLLAGGVVGTATWSAGAIALWCNAESDAVLKNKKTFQSNKQQIML